MHRYDSCCICFSLVLIDSFFNMGKNYYPQVFLEECKNIFTEKKMKRYFDSDYELTTSSDGSDESYDSNKETDK